MDNKTLQYKAFQCVKRCILPTKQKVFNTKRYLLQNMTL